MAQCVRHSPHQQPSTEDLRLTHWLENDAIDAAFAELAEADVAFAPPPLAAALARSATSRGVKAPRATSQKQWLAADDRLMH